MICEPCQRRDHVNCVTAGIFARSAAGNDNFGTEAIELLEQQACTWCDCQHQPVASQVSIPLVRCAVTVSSLRLKPWLEGSSGYTIPG